MEEKIEESKKNEFISYKIVFSNKVILMTYDTSFPEFREQTIESLIKEVLSKLGPKSSNKAPNDFNFHCPCGQILEHKIKLSNNLCIHPYLEDFQKCKLENGGYLLDEKQKIEEEINEKLSEEEINQLIKQVFPEKEHQECNSQIDNEKIHSFAISKNLINKIKELKKKEERAKRLIETSSIVYYNEEYYKDLVEMGIDKNKAKAALRETHNNKEEAALLSTDNNICFEYADFFYCDNEDVLTKEKFENLCLEEIQKEYPFIDNKDEIKIRFKEILNKISKDEENNSGNKNSEENDE